MRVTIFLVLALTGVSVAQTARRPKTTGAILVPRFSPLIGVWQEGDSILSAGWEDAYAFFPDGKFDFYTSQYSYLTQIRSLHGYYRVSHDTLYTEIDSRTELVGGRVARGDPQIEGEWELDGGKWKVIKQRPRWEGISMTICTKGGARPCFSLMGDKFFKISDNPKYYQLNH